MPKIVINEKDFSGNNGAAAISTAVFIPGLIGQSATEQAAEGVITLCESVRSFEAAFGTKPATITAGTTESSDKSWVMAHTLLQLGLPVYYVGFSTKTSLETAIDGTDLWTEVTDRGLYDIRFITVGGYPSTSRAGVMITAAKTRGDAVAILDTTSDITKLKVESGSEEITVPGYFNTIADTLTDKEDLKFAAAFTPWCYCDGLAAQLQLEDTDFEMPATFIYLGAFANSLKNNNSWLAAAGAYRGLVPFTFSPKVAFGDAAIDALQSRESSKLGINPICSVRPFGNIVYGNRTLLPNAAPEKVAGGLIASSFLNIRHLACELKKVIYNAARKYTFEPNDNLLWNAFCAEIQPVLDRMKSGRGIKGSKIIKVTTSEKATLKAKVRVTPIEANEDFYIDVELADSLEVVEG